jgi:hypothetical protein
VPLGELAIPASGGSTCAVGGGSGAPLGSVVVRSSGGVVAVGEVEAGGAAGVGDVVCRKSPTAAMTATPPPRAAAAMMGATRLRLSLGTPGPDETGPAEFEDDSRLRARALPVTIDEGPVASEDRGPAEGGRRWSSVLAPNTEPASVTSEAGAGSP